MIGFILIVILFLGAILIISDYCSCCGRKIHTPAYEMGRIDPINNSSNQRNNQTTGFNSNVETSGHRNSTEPELARILRILNMDYRCYSEPAMEERRSQRDELSTTSAANQEIRRSTVPGESEFPGYNTVFLEDPPPSYDEAVGNINTRNHM